MPRHLLRYPFFLLALLLFMAACQRQQKKAPIAELPPVSIAIASKKEMPQILSSVAVVEPYHTVSIRARVTGELINVHFQEGHFVKKGDLLFEIDPRPYEAALDEAKATLLRHQAQLEHDRVQDERYQNLIQKGFVSKEQAAQMHTNRLLSEAQVLADIAAVKAASLNLEYTRIRSPIDGRTGVLQVHEGNLVQPNTEVLVVIHQITPLWVRFDVPEKYALTLREKLKTQLPVQVRGENIKTPLVGKLAFVDNAIQMATGTLRVKALFGNENHELWPGQYVTASLELARKSGVVIPSQAVQLGPDGEFVYIVKDGKAIVCPVQVAMRNDTEALIAKGLPNGATVITSGQFRLKPGIGVRVIH
jgi:multidrug efflux system membrane fusion protein